MEKPTFCCEVSWEVCNKVGGIYTVLRSKLTQVRDHFGDNYVLIGPMLEHNKHFDEVSSPFIDEAKKILAAKNLNCRLGYWDTEGRPLVILVDFRNRYNIDALLYQLWADYGVDSLASNFEYQEPILFSTAAAEVITSLTENSLVSGKQVIAHFHEWMCGAGLLYIKKHRKDIPTIFTTHATVLGRSLAGSNRLIYNLPQNFDPGVEAKRHGVFSKHSLEKAAAMEATCFTTVSSITADESNIILGKYPDKIVFNGLDIKKKVKQVEVDKISEARSKMMQVARKVIGKDLPDNTNIWLTSGRYEFHNKGYDVLLRSLAKMEGHLPDNSSPLVVFFLVAIAWQTRQESLLESDIPVDPSQKSAVGLATHKIYDPINDSVIRLCNELGFKNPDRKIHVIFCNAYLSGNDGVFDVIYEQLLAAGDLSIFPSFYEPWGYTPLESLAYATPTVTTNLAGFGCWVNDLKKDYEGAVYVLPRKDDTEQGCIDKLSDYLLQVIRKHGDLEYQKEIRQKSLSIAELADWQYFYQDYIDAYHQAIQFNELSFLEFETEEAKGKFVTSIRESEVTLPRFRSFQFECILPEKIAGLRELACNFWWAWHDDARALFQKIDYDLWEKVRRNPVHFLNMVPSAALQKAADNEEYVWLYNKVLTRFHDYEKKDERVIKFCDITALNSEHPIAYFCMEYGISECLPIYSGGLGILAGDYLKTMSDLRVPMVAVGLFYKQGYFRQYINAQGEQVAIYETWDTNHIPMKLVTDEAGKVVLTTVEVLDRTVFIRAWLARVGHVDLYLLDTNVPENNPQDREITNSLYGGSIEVRLIQEMVLGIGGARFLVDKLKIVPALFHLNEGHSAFLLLERVRDLCHHGFSFDEACLIVRYSSIFTTHTPVPAGNEAFPESLIKKYFSHYGESLGISIDKLLGLAKDVDPNSKLFSMTVLSLKLTLTSNAVSQLHGKVAREMWQGIWPGWLEDEIPITAVTNGVHVATWLGNTMRSLYNDYLPTDWMKKQDDPAVWEKIATIPDQEIWRSHQVQKETLLNLVNSLIIKQYTLRNESKDLIGNSLRCLNKDTLLIGLSRRFTSYKRNDLFLRDKERLAQILNNTKRPVVILISGKAHPADGGGQQLIKSMIEMLREKIFNGHIIFLEEYNIILAKALVRGVDVWLNTPILGREACGTSGMKVGINGGLNFSTLDGWWEEAYSDKVGWAIESLVDVGNIEERNDIESMFLLNALESNIVPLYYDKQRSGFSAGWVEKMKASLSLVTRQYNTYRMVRDYVDNMYCPTIVQMEHAKRQNFGELKSIVKWRHDIVDRFNSVKIKAILINGIKQGKIMAKGLVKIKVLLFSGKLSSRELKVEFILVKTDGRKFIAKPLVIPFSRVESTESGILTYVAQYHVEDTGFYSYGVRIFPYNSLLYRDQDVGVVYWG